MFRAIPGLLLSDDLTLRIGDGAPLRLTPSYGFELAQVLLRRSAENAVREAARATPPEPAPRSRAKRRAA